MVCGGAKLTLNRPKSLAVQLRSFKLELREEAKGRSPIPLST